jgi:hypothetical protein
MWLFSLVFNISLELCLLGLASFLGLLCFGLFGDFIPKGENVGPKHCVNIGREDKKGGKFDLGGFWMMVSIQASVSGSNSVNSCKFILALVVLS